MPQLWRMRSVEGMLRVMYDEPFSAEKHVAHIQTCDVHFKYDDAEEASEGVCSFFSKLVS